MSDEITPLTKEEGQSKDLVKENVEKLKQLFPEIVTDGKVDFETLKEELGEFRETSDERYSFTWNGKGKARKLAMEPSRGTLRPAPEESVNWDDTKHLFIEGDNLEVLKLLQRSYHKKVKMIYIDPPYNTGNDFVYSDDYKDNLLHYLGITGQLDDEGKKISSNPDYSGRYHTDWLNMMYPRIKLARELLKSNGVMFISIDDHEVHNLIKICNEIFGEENFVGNITWVKKRKGSFLSNNLVSLTEYILIYSRDISEVKLFGGKPDSTESQPLIKRTNATSVLNIPSGVIETKLDDGIYEKGNYGEGTSSVELLEDTEVEDGLFIKPVKVKGPFIWSQEYLNDQLSKGAELVINTNNFQIRAFKADTDERFKGLPSLINGVKINGTNEDGYEELRDILGKENLMDYPKPKNLIKYLIRAGTYFDENPIILDFFAGSATTTHATFDLNREYEKECKSIAIQLPELIDEGAEAFKEGYETVSEIGKERVRRVIDNMKEKYPDYNGDLGFKVFKLGSSNIKPWDPSFDDVQLSIEDSIENVKPDRSELDLLYEVLLKYGIDLSLPIEEQTIDGSKVYVGGAGALVLCPSDTITLEVVEGIAEIKEEFQPEIMRVVFRDSGFKDDVVKTNAIQILKQHGIEDVKSI